MNTLNYVKVYAPATIANVGPGFDVLGLAIDAPGDIVIAKKKPEPGLSFTLLNEQDNLPANDKNVAAHVANLMLEQLQPPFGVSLVLQKQMPIGSGLGSSGASSAAAAYAVNALLPTPLTKSELVAFAVEGEMLASGAPHADNVAPSLLGGACLIRHTKPLDVIDVPIWDTLFWVVIHPHLEVETSMARAALPEYIALSKMVHHCGNLAGLITGLITGNAALISRSLQDDIIEPIRAQWIPGFHEIKSAAFTAGALAFSISGSGPSVFAITTSDAIAKRVAQAIEHTFFTVANVRCDHYISPLNKIGAKILEQSS